MTQKDILDALLKEIKHIKAHMPNGELKQMMKDIICIDFKGKNAHDYYVEKYGEEKILCDETHFNDCTNEEMIKDFFTPELTKLKKIIEIKKKARRK